MQYEDVAVNKPADLQQVLEGLDVIRFKDLPEGYQTETQSNRPPFAQMLKSKRYYRMTGAVLYQKIVGHYRIRDFLPHDQYFKRHMRGLDTDVYWLVDVTLLQKFLELQANLRKKGYDDHAFRIYNGYRHPAYNAAIGGASRSRHILGQAVDISIRDINRDGTANQIDKDIVLKILDEEVIGNHGGLGRYPGTMSVHFDVRGRRARWDTH